MNPILLRKQLQENASDLQDFCKDLKNWGEEMKRKEDALKNGGDEKLSPEREIDHKKAKNSDKIMKKSKCGTTQNKNMRKAGATDYAAWDKFDADAECEKEIEKEDSESSNDLNENNQDLAIIQKEKGNKFIKSQKWDEAIKCYNKAIEHYSNDPIFYANRALCYLKKCCYEEAEKDCSLSLGLDRTYVKAYQRRAVARESMNKLKQAEQDLVRILELEPDNKESKELLDKLRQKLGTIDKEITPAQNIESIRKKPITKMGSTDYAAWDKFDADAECNKLEDDINEDELTDECNDNMQDLAILEKEKGNKFVKNQNWDEAIKCYNKAIEYYSYDHIFYANRGLCYLKKGSYEEAEKDCTLSLKLNGTYVKAYQRRAAARENLNKLQHAEYDILKALDFEPANKESKELLEKLRLKLGKTNKVLDQRPVSKFTASRNKYNVSKTSTTHPSISSLNPEITESKKVFDTSKPIPSWPEDEDILVVKPIKKPPHLRSKKPLKRIKIVEKDSSVIESKVIISQSEPEAVKQHIVEKREEMQPLKDVSIIKNETSNIEPNSVKKVSFFKNRKGEKASESSDHSTAWPKSDHQVLCLKSDDFKVIEKTPPDISQLTVISKEVKNTSNISISNENKKVDNDNTDSEFVKPKTSVQFNLTWKNLKNSEEKYKYLKQVNPQDLPKIFLNSLESHVFSNILEVLVEHFVENKDCVFDILEYFTQVKRFGAFTMFMSAYDKRNLWKLFDYVKEVEQKSKEDVDRLLDKYEL